MVADTLTVATTAKGAYKCFIAWFGQERPTAYVL